MTRSLQRARHRKTMAVAGVGMLAAGAAWPSPAQAGAGEIDYAHYHGIEVLAADELGGMRGGFFDAFGILVEFGAEIHTIIDGTPVLLTNLTMNETGAFDRTLIHVPSGEDLTASGVTSVSVPGGVELQLVGEDFGSSLAEVLPQLAGLDGTSGFVFEDGSGVTAVLHDVSVGRLVNTIANTGSGRDIVQEMHVTITLHNMGDFTENTRLESLHSALGTF